MPLLSFVLVVHGEQAYLQDCTASLLGQEPDDVELVAVDDASPDHAPELLDELARRDPRVRVEHLSERAGLGAARNIGLELAEGRFLWFVHTTDLLPPRSPAAIARRLRAEEPDVLLVHHREAGPLGGARDGTHGELLRRVEAGGPGPLERHPGVADAAPLAWNKVLRRELVRELGLQFRPQGHGELTVTWPALLAAERIAASPAAGYVRRRPGNAVRDRLTEGSPADVFGACEAVLQLAGELPDARRRIVVTAMVRHQLALLETVPAAERRAFQQRVSDFWRRHGSGEEPLPATAHPRAALLAGDIRRRGAAAARLGARAAGRARRTALHRYYRARLDEPVDPDLAVFAAYWYRGYACNPRAIYERARELVPRMRGVWVVKEDSVAAMPPGVEHVVAGTRAYFDVLARAAYFVNNVNFPNFVVKREGTVHVMTHHGTPLKRMGLDLRQHPVTGRRMDFAALLRRCERWDYSISANAFSTLVWERVYPVPYESLEVGYPRNDALANAGEDDVAAARRELGLRADQVAVLYAPTHREYQPGYAPVEDLAGLADALGPDHVVLARTHYLEAADPLLRELDAAGRLRDVASHPSVETLCLAADVLVTDYSSLMFDYAVLDRPIVVHAPDWEAYRTLRGTYLDLMTEGPGVVTRTDAELAETLRSRAARAAFRDRFCSLEDGRAAERVVRRVWLGERGAADRPQAPALR